MSILSYKWVNTVDLNQQVDTSLQIDGSFPYRLTIPLNPQYPQYINDIVLDLTGSYLDPNCLDPQDARYIYPLFSRIMVTANDYHDVYFDRTYPYSPNDGSEWNAQVHLNLNRPIVYPTSQTITLLFFPSICHSHIPRLNSIVFAYRTTTPSSSSSTSLSRDGWVFVGLGIAILILLFIILILLINM